MKTRYIDIKVSHWERIIVPDTLTDEQVFEVLDSNTEAFDVVNDLSDLLGEPMNVSVLEETEEFMSVEENKGQETMVFFTPKKIRLWSNVSNKQQFINKIEELMDEFGTVSVTEILGAETQVYDTKNNVKCLIERYNRKDVEVTMYVDGLCEAEFLVLFEDLPYDTLEAILNQLDDYSADVTKWSNRSQN